MRLLLLILTGMVSCIAIAAVSRSMDWSPFATAIAGMVVGIVVGLAAVIRWGVPREDMRRIRDELRLAAADATAHGDGFSAAHLSGIADDVDVILGGEPVEHYR